MLLARDRGPGGSSWPPVAAAATTTAPAPPARRTAEDDRGTPTARGTGQAGGILRIGTTDQIDSLNPFVAFNAESYQAFVINYPLLVQYSPDFEWEGDWAESWETSQDGLTWTFHLKPGEWSDGTPLTAEDAVWTATRSCSSTRTGPTAIARALPVPRRGLEAPDPETLVITYEQPVGNVLPQPAAVLHPPEARLGAVRRQRRQGPRSSEAEDDLPLVGGGAFVITKFDKKGTTIYEKNPGFYGPQPYVDAVGYQIFENEDAMLDAFAAGELDFIDELPPNAVATLEATTTFVVSNGSRIPGEELHLQLQPDKPEEPRAARPGRREAFAYAIETRGDRRGRLARHAKPWASIVAPPPASG